MPGGDALDCSATPESLRTSKIYHRNAKDDEVLVLANKYAQKKRGVIMMRQNTALHYHTIIEDISKSYHRRLDAAASKLLRCVIKAGYLCALIERPTHTPDTN